MDFFSVLLMAGGLSFFLFGMHTMSSSLEKMAGGRLDRLLRRVTANPFLSLFLGIAITAAVQSSSATTVMLVGLVGSGIMRFSQTVYVILGSNIGTTLTGWILSLSGIESSSIFVGLLKPANFSPVVALIGVVLLLFSRSDRKKTVGSALVGFGLLMYGMTMMSDAVSPLSGWSGFSSMIAWLSNPVTGLLLALAFTAVVQSSAASIGILQALSMTGQMSVGMMIPLVMGLNIGTCATSLISCIGSKTEAKRVAFMHLSVKLLGALICLPIYLILQGTGVLPFTGTAAAPWSIALIHTVYNLILTVLFLPLSKPLIRLAEKLLKDRETARPEPVMLDERLLRVPSVAVEECRNRTVEMCALACETLRVSFGNLFANSEKTAAVILQNEDRLDAMEDQLGTYLVPLGAKTSSAKYSHTVSGMLHCIGDFERMGDHAVNLLKVASEMSDKQIAFSPDARAELDVLIRATEEILDLTERAYRNSDAELAGHVEPLEQTIDALIAAVKDRHINRLVAGNCTLELGFVLSDILTNFERVSDHCSNVAVALIRLKQDSFDTHSYLNGIKYGNADFDREVAEYAQKYAI